MDKGADEKILDFISEAEKREARKDNFNGSLIKISDRYYEFEEKSFFDEKLKIYIPNNFENMPLEERKLNVSLDTIYGRSHWIYNI
ncbi:hypothetical protein [Clostridium saccharoperbutylacetonicum]|uniref:hypothetical protein n=1 Tax=Clostridium saccharoperbutylacetonicum TaxID=36745 RepID=UPI0039EBEF1D